MKKPNSMSKLIPIAVLIGMIVVFTCSFLRGSFLVKLSEKELNPKKQLEEAQASTYTLKEIDAKTGQIRWQLNAKEGKTENNLQTALIKDIDAEVYKNNKVIFKLTAPYAKANAQTKEIYLFKGVTAKNKTGDFLLTSNQVSLGMGTSIEAQKGFNLVLKDTGNVSGENALINDDQTDIQVINLKEAQFKDITLSGKNVHLEKENNGDIQKATITNGGNVILKREKNSSLTANTIKWEKSGKVEARGNVVYISEDKIFKADYLVLKPDGEIYAKDNVFISHGQTKCYGDILNYENNSFITLNGNPKAIQGDKRISANKIVYDLNTSKVSATGNVKTIVINKSEKT